MNLTASNGNGQVLRSNFKVNFVEKDDTLIYSISKGKVEQRVLYNCGDNRFSFAINGYFNGPNYELSPGEASSYFNFTRKDMVETFSAPFNFS